MHYLTIVLVVSSLFNIAHARIIPDKFKEVETRIDHVLSYSDRALVKRVTKLKDLETEWFKISALPKNIQKDSIKIKINGTNDKTISQIIIGEAYYKNTLPLNVDKMLNELKEKYLERLELEQKITLLNLEVNFLNGLNFDSPFASNKDQYLIFETTTKLLDQSLNAISNASLDYHLEKEKLNGKLNKLNDEIRVLSSKLRDSKYRRSQEWLTDIYVKTNQANLNKNSKLELEYVIPNASWIPEYDIRCHLDMNKGKANINLVTMGKLDNKTGENWDEVGLTLSSIDPAPLFMPKLNRWLFSEKREEVPEETDGEMFADMVAPQVARRERIELAKAKKLSNRAMAPQAKGAGFAGAPAPMMESMELSDDMVSSQRYDGKKLDKNSVQKYPQNKTNLFVTNQLENIYRPLRDEFNYVENNRLNNSQFRAWEDHHRGQITRRNYRNSNLPAVQAAGRKVEYESNFKISLNSHEDPLRVPVDTTTLKGDLEYLLIPKKDKKAYLQTRVQNTSGKLILGGSANVYLDGDLTSKTNLRATNEKSSILLDLGVDEAIESKRIVKKESEKSGMIFKSHEMVVEVELQVVNNHSFPIEINIKDNYPNAPNDKIKVELKNVTPSPLSKKYGVIHWKTKIAGNKKETFKFKYQVTHPENFIIQGYDL